MPETYHVKLSDGREFNVTTEGGAPSESDVLAGLGHNSNVSPVSPNEPGTFAGGVWKSVKEQFGNAAGPAPTGDEMPFAHASSDATQQMMNTPIVHPTGTRLDGLLSPAGVAGGALAVGGMVRPGTAARTAATALQEVPSLRKWVPGANMLTGKLRMIGQAAQDASMGVTRGADMYAMPKTASVVERAPRAVQTIGEAGSRPPFHELPLQEQMAQLPSDTPAPMTSRTGISIQPRQTPFHELPLERQMARLPESGGVPSSRAGESVFQPQTPFTELPLYKQMEQLPPTGAPAVARGPEPPYRSSVAGRLEMKPAESATPPDAGMTATERAALARQGYSPELIAKIEQQIQPAASHEPTTQTRPPANQMRQPRIDVGAEVVGRQNNLTKEAVRQQTGPILDEAVGDASPILPEKALQRIIDTMKALPKEGGAREAYVQAATSGKTMAQVENIRRTLMHLGLIAPPVAVALRGQLRMAPSHAPTTTNQGAVGSEIQQ